MMVIDKKECDNKNWDFNTLTELAENLKKSFSNIKTRVFEDKNYLGVKLKNLTSRYNDADKGTILELDYPEFYDVDIFTVKNEDPTYKSCTANCPYCYLDAGASHGYVKNAPEMINKIFGKMDENQRPFQVALPGSGEVTAHPELEEILKTFRALDIEPNCTTNGMWAKDDWDKYYPMFEKYCGGIAITCHSHLKEDYRRVLDNYKLHKTKITLNTHHLISTQASVDEFLRVYNAYKGIVESFVLLPLESSGRQKKPVKIAWKYLVERLKELDGLRPIVFGANFYEYLKDDPFLKDKVDIYEPEIMSGFLRLEDGNLYKSSFNWELKQFQIL